MGEQVLLSSTIQMPSQSSSTVRPLVLRTQEGLQTLRRMLPWVRGVLKDAEEREILDESIWIWLRELRGVAYDAEDVLDEFEYHGLRADAGARAEADAGAPGRTSWPGGRHLLHASFSSAPTIVNTLFWHKLDLKVEVIKRRFEEICEGRKALRLTMEDGERGRLGAARASARTPSSCFIATQCFYGREREKKEVIDGFLLSQQCLARKLFVIPIVGMGGVGKTTLVQHIYNDPAVSKQFEMKGWVCVSDDFNLVVLTRKILEALTKKPRDLNEFSTLQEALARAVEGKKFLLVLDDMWNEKNESWELLKAPLLSCAEGSAIVTTTRNEHAAAIAQTAPPLRLRCLPDQECWKIFQKQAFGGRDPSCHQDLVEIGRKIVRKCKGLPLAVKALGGLLRFKPDVQSWEDILHGGFWDLDGQGDEVISALRLSYLHLKTNLRQCFVYCSLFPKAYRFTKSQLVYMWVAQGFIIQHGTSRHAEDISSEYFEELLQRSFFQYSQGEQLSRRPEECEETHVVMHDLIHGLAQSISMGECSRQECVEARSVSVAGTRQFTLAQPTSRRVRSAIAHGKTLGPPIIEPHHSDLARECFRIEHGELQCLPTTGVRHLSLVGSITPCNTVAAGTLRTFLILKVRLLLPSQSRLLNNMIPYLRCVWVLDFSHLPICELPDAFGNLIHLRYLNLSHTQIKKLPKSVCKLHHMQTLLLTGCERLQGLPQGMKNLSNLRTLPVFHVGRYDQGCSGVEELRGLVNLRGGLTIYRLSHVLNVSDAKMANLRNKASLRELRLSWANVLAAPVRTLNLPQISECWKHMSMVVAVSQAGWEVQPLISW